MKKKLFDLKVKNKTQEYVLCQSDNGMGQIALSKQAFETIAMIAVMEHQEVLDNKNKKNVNCLIKDGSLNINCELKFKFNTDVNAVTSLIQEKIYQTILDMTGFKVNAINVNVVGFDY